jgi:hypothetical protein
MLAPPITVVGALDATLRAQGHAVLDAAGVLALLGLPDCTGFDAIAPLWDELPPDAWLRDGGQYRRRRHGCFIVRGGSIEAVAHRAHFQPVEYNALHGGLERWFEPLDARMVSAPIWPRLLAALAAHASALKGEQPWYVEAHPFRIDTTGGIGRPTPEGAHRDGVDLVAVMLVARVGIRGGETRVFEATGPHGIRFTLAEPWTLLVLDDARVIHETTPIQPLDAARLGHRDTLVLTFRAGGFQGPITALRTS